MTDGYGGSLMLDRPSDLNDLNDLFDERVSGELKPFRSKHPGATILVVDDEPEIVIAVSMRLKSAGYKVIAARDGMQATKMALQENPDVVILDIGMPCGDGHAIASRLADSISTMMVPVIFLTARTSQNDRSKAQSVRAFDYITKPFTSGRLLNAVEAALDSRS